MRRPVSEASLEGTQPTMVKHGPYVTRRDVAPQSQTSESRNSPKGYISRTAEASTRKPLISRQKYRVQAIRPATMDHVPGKPSGPSKQEKVPKPLQGEQFVGRYIMISNTENFNGTRSQTDTGSIVNQSTNASTSV